LVHPLVAELKRRGNFAHRASRNVQPADRAKVSLRGCGGLAFEIDDRGGGRPGVTQEAFV